MHGRDETTSRLGCSVLADSLPPNLRTVPSLVVPGQSGKAELKSLQRSTRSFRHHWSTLTLGRNRRGILECDTKIHLINYRAFEQPIQEAS